MQSRNLGNIEIQGSRANEIKQSATWDATQAFLCFSFQGVVLSVFSFWHVFLFLSVIEIGCLFVFRTQDSSSNGELIREAHSKSTKGLELHSGSFLRLRNFCKKFEFDPLYNVTTLKEVENTSLCHIATLVSTS